MPDDTIIKTIHLKCFTPTGHNHYLVREPECFFFKQTYNLNVSL